jgi:hypothetical protein
MVYGPFNICAVRKKPVLLHISVVIHAITIRGEMWAIIPPFLLGGHRTSESS